MPRRIADVQVLGLRRSFTIMFLRGAIVAYSESKIDVCTRPSDEQQ